MAEFGYDLLKIYYLCGSSNSLATVALVLRSLRISMRKP